MAVIWIYTLYVAAVLASTSWADENDHIHIKLHLPEVLKKHTHVKTVYKHHYHPKKITNAHLIKGSFGKFEPEGSHSMLNPVVALSKPSAFPPSIDFDSNSWTTHNNGLDEVLGMSPNTKPRLHHFNLPNDWATREHIPIFSLSHKPMLPQQIKPEPIKDYSTDEKFTGGGKNYDDDEDEEFMMTEDSINEQPFAMQLRDPANYALAMHYKNSGRWAGTIADQLENYAVHPALWRQLANSDSQFSPSGFGSMQQFNGYENQPGNYELETQMPIKPPGKPTKRPNKGKSKKRKRLNMNQKTAANFAYNSK